MDRLLSFAAILSTMFLLVPALAQAQVRDAASKALGDYARGGGSSVRWSAPARVYQAPQVVARQPAATAPGAPQAATAPANPDTRQAARPQAERRFSYDPQPTSVAPRFAPARPSYNSVRGADTKARGAY